MIKYGKVVDSGRAALGVTVRTVIVTSGNGSQTSGAGVVSVTSGGPADKGGIQAGDVITQLADTPIDSSQALSTALATLKPGQQVTVTYLRDGASRTAKVTLGTLS
jgi:S1-C subfamily serine protease